MENSKPRYRLDDVKAAFADPSGLNRTYSSREGADDLGMSDAEVVDVIQSLTSADFDKSMTAYADQTLWQDVYKPLVDKVELYVKFTLDSEQKLLLISFKEA